MKDLIAWKKDFKTTINAVLDTLDDTPNQENTYHLIIDKIIDVNFLYHKFTLEALSVPAPKTREAMSKLEGLRSFDWTTNEVEF